jgi:L-ascorbate metabolism protein UlaG (beta-lactamase superfamily)
LTVPESRHVQQPEIEMKKSFKVVLMVAVASLAAGVVLAASFLMPTLRPAPVLTGPPPAPLSVQLKPARGQGQMPGAFTVTRIAHASVLLDFGNATVLTDPWFSEKTHFHHGEPLGISLEQLPRLTAVVASHEHYDHFDIETFAKYPYKDVPFFVGPNMLAAARAAGFTNVRELRPWESANAGPLTITAAPAAHKVPEVTFVIQANGATVYFGGDTRLIPELDELPKRFPSVQLALLSVNGLRVMGEQVVMNAEQAADFAGRLGAEVAVPIHYRFHGSWFTDSFVLSYDGTPERFENAAKTRAPATAVRVLAPGQVLRFAP